MKKLLLLAVLALAMPMAIFATAVLIYQYGGRWQVRTADLR